MSLPATTRTNDHFVSLAGPTTGRTGGTDEKRAIARHIFGDLPTDNEIDHIFSQAQTFGTINDALAKRMAKRANDRLYGLIKGNGYSVWTNYLFPWSQLKVTDSIDIEWSEIKFDSGIAGALSPLGVPRIHGHQRIKHSQRMIRRGVGLFIESGFFTSPEGRRVYELQIAQLAAITLQTCEYDVALAILDSWVNQPKHAYQLGFQGDTDGHDGYMNFLKTEVETFGLVNKTPDERGLINLNTRFQTLMSLFSDGGSRPDTWIFPPQMQTFYKLNNDSNWDYSKSGPIAVESRKKTNYVPPENGIRFETFQGMKIIDTQMYRSTSQSRYEAGDILTLTKQIGEWYPMDSRDLFPESNDFENYRTKDRNIQIFNEDQDNFDVVLFRNAIDNSFRFQGENGDWSQHMIEFAQNASPNDTEDMFIFHNGSSNCMLTNAWCDVNTTYLPEEQLRSVCNTLKNVMVAKGYSTVTAETFKSTFNFEMMGIEQYDANGDAVPANLIDFNGAVDEENIRNKNNVRAYGEIFKAECNDVAVSDYIKLKKLWLLTKINGNNFKICCDMNVHIPIGILLFRPNMTYRVSSAVLMKAGAETGRTYIGQQDFAVNNYNMNKSIAGSFTFFSKAVTLERRNIMVAEDIFIQNYVRGHNTNFITWEEIDQEVKLNGGTTYGQNSMYAFMVPVDWKNEEYRRDILDIRGSNNNLFVGTRGRSSEMFKGAHFYGDLLSINGTHVSNPSEQEKDYNVMEYMPNSICFRGFYEYGLGGRFDQFKVGTGHLPTAYPGVGRTRNSLNFVPLKECYGSKMKSSRG